MTHLDSMATPAGVVDLDRMERNLRGMQRYAAAHRLALRPHAKTHKSPAITRQQIEHGAVGITVATTVEADRLGPDTPELLLAYPPLGPRASAAAASARVRPTLVALDSPFALDALRAAAQAAGVQVGVLVELDVGMRRCGVPDAAAALRLARACDDDVPFRGVMFYPGHIREPVAEQDAALEALARSVAATVTALGDAGIAPAIVSGGSTPTAFRSHEVPHLTEIRPGTYVFNDRTTYAIGACAHDDVAYSVLATVVSTAVDGQAVVDAGSKALSSDVLRAAGKDGYGELLDRPEVAVSRLSEEHGVLDLSRTDWRPRVGERVRIMPNHVCVSVNLQTVVHGFRGGRLERSWSPAARGWDSLPIEP
ncbi:MAG TPA: alanine racemase [Longimicrobiales bacterium]